MMGVLNEEQESFITKFKKIKEFKDEGFKNVFSEKISGGIPDKTGEFYYVFPQTNSGCKVYIFILTGEIIMTINQKLGLVFVSNLSPINILVIHVFID